MVASLNPKITPSQTAKLERKAMLFWSCIICGFFAIDLSVAAIAISMAAGDPSFRSIPGYGERAIAWDVRRERSKMSSELGWTVELKRVRPRFDSVEITLRDEKNEPLVGCSGSARMFHFTRVAEQFQSNLKEVGPGIYHATIDVSRAGRWQMDLDIQAEDGRHFWSEQTLNWFEDVDQEGVTSK